MGQAKNISAATVGDMSTAVSTYDVGTASTDGASGVDEVTWINPDSGVFLAYYNSIPELNSTIRTRATWVLGKGVEADKATMEIMDKWRGWGKDSKNTLIQNMIITAYVGGDFFAQIIRDDSVFRKIFMWFGVLDPGKPVNLKPLDPGAIKIVIDKQGMLKEYRQVSKNEDTPDKVIKPENMFHLAKDRFADQCHGTSVIPALRTIIDSRAEARADQRIVFHRYVKPLWIWQLDTDDTTKIAAFKTKADLTVANSENIYIPKGAAEAERVSVPQYSTLDPQPYIDDLGDSFYQGTNTPAVIVGTTKGANEASAKVVFLGYEQSVRVDQLWIMDNFKSQLGLDIKLEFPTPIEGDFAEDASRDKQTSATKPNETKVSIKGQK